MQDQNKELRDQKNAWNHERKMIAPILITAFFLLYLVVYLVIVIGAAVWNPVFLIAAIPLAALGIGMIFTLKSRIDEIKRGEEDDLSNY